MKRIEIITSTVFAIGLIFKLLSWPGSRLFISVSLIILSYYYFIFSFALFNKIKIKNIFKKDSYKNKSRVHIILSIFLGISISIILNGIMYILNNWQVDINLIVIGTISTIISLILYYIFNKNIIKNWRSIYLRSIILIFIGLMIYLKFAY